MRQWTKVPNRAGKREWRLLASDQSFDSLQKSSR